MTAFESAPFVFQQMANRIDELTAQLILKDQELQVILSGRAWKLVTALRKIRSRILSTSSLNKNQ